MSLLKSINEITKDMSIYGLSTLIGQVISFFLLPLYTSYLTPGDYGILSIIGMLTGGYGILSNFGINSAIFRFTGLAKSEEQKLEYLDTAQFLNVFLNMLFCSMALVFSGMLSLWLFNADTYELFFKFGILMGFISSLASIPLSYLRVRRKTVKIAYSSFLNLGVSIACTIIGLVVLKWGVWGALVGNTAGNVISMVFLFWNVNIPKWNNFSIIRSKALLNYALPMFPHKALMFLLPMFSQVLLIRFLSLETLGIYNIAYKFCLPLNMFINLFQKSYSPYRFEVLQQEKESKELFNKINLAFFLIVFMGYTLTILFGDDIIKVLISPDFYSAGTYLIFIALIPIGRGLFFIFGTGIEFSKSPRFMPVISGTGFVITLVLSYILIPAMGISGAAIAPTIGYLSMAAIVYFYAQRLYDIPYSWSKYVLIITVTVSLHLCNHMLNHDSIVIDIMGLFIYISILGFIFRRHVTDIFKNRIKREGL